LHSDITVHLAVVIRPLQWITVLSCIFILILGLLTYLRRRLLSGRTTGESNTWDCGFARPTARMQYTASSYAQPITTMFGFFLQTHRKVHAPEGLFPAEADLHTHTDDVFSQRLFEPLFRRIEQLFLRLHWLQQGRVQIYVLYVAVTILALLIWNLR